VSLSTTNDAGLENAMKDSRMYDENLPLIKRYFHKEMAAINVMQINASTEDQYKDTIMNKSGIWAAACHLAQIEDRLAVSRWLRLMLLIFTFSALISGVLMNFSYNASSFF
jgi:hypothetical protein